MSWRVALRGRLIERARAGEAGEGLEREVLEVVEAEAGSLPEADRAALRERVLLLATGLGPLEPLLSDPSVDEVMVNGPGEVYVERRGRIEPTGVGFSGEAELMHAIERVLAPLGRRVDEASPLCDARLADGSRVNVVIPPLSLSGPCMTIRRFRRQGFSLRDLVRGGTLRGGGCGAVGRVRGRTRLGARVRGHRLRARPPRSTRSRGRSRAPSGS